MNLPVFIFPILIQSVFSLYLFKIGMVSFSRIGEPKVRNKTYTHVSSIDQHHFANAKDIRVRTSEMWMVEGAVKNLPHLRALRLKKCGIRNLPQRTFRNLPNLEYLHLQDNYLSKIVDGVFNHLPIRELWLHKNWISFIMSGAFDNMPNLEHIKLNKNNLMKWDSRWFANTPNVRILEFKRNKIEELPPRAFTNINPVHKVNGTELVDTCIYFTRNAISRIDPHAFQELDALAHLSLKNNQLEEIDPRTFAHMSELHVLSVKGNFLTRIERNSFESMSQMDKLDLSDNELKCLPFEVAAVAKTVKFKNNAPDCDCLNNLRERLREEGSENMIEEARCSEKEEED